ncbi:MAG: UbiD family decarboxylase [Pigmentiphaga sp.]|uniref:UbiD family decarboxylase n=1 Tax=Pigmentiphaga sp. TaxID=1977564 RepID=UPI0029A74B1E|nr:UbiD family decarboxylase [Pigmentiphaga sp.]MDX3907802.1 UbiD family decarboxylase [Pigmentiphaga sp.]
MAHIPDPKPTSGAGTGFPDLERYSLGSFLQSLPADQLEIRDGATELTEIAGVLEGNPRAVLFQRPARESLPLCGNVSASRWRLAHAFGARPQTVAETILERMRRPGVVVEVGSDIAPVQQVVQTGDQCDLTTLPVHLQHGLDGAPYISASLDFSRDPATGWTNVGMRRLMLRGRRTAGIDLVAPSDLRAIYLSHVAKGERLPIAFAIGSHPIDHLAGTLRLPMDELQLMAALRGAPMGVVKCVTNDLRVPADAQFVIEGYLDERGHAEPEGPYGEFLGYYGVLKRNPVFHVTAITRRRNAVFQTATIGGHAMAMTDTAQLCSLRTELMVWRGLETAVREVTAVYVPPATGGAFNARVAIRQRVAGEARNAIAAVFASAANIKHVFVVDPDIDIFNDEQMDWALATRFQADRDLVVQSGLRAMPLDPSLAGAPVTAKAGFDLTLPLLEPGRNRPLEYRVPSPPVFDAPRCASLDEALAGGPKYFAELMASAGSKDGREIVRWLEDTAAKRPLVRDEEGRYRFE